MSPHNPRNPFDYCQEIFGDWPSETVTIPRDLEERYAEYRRRGDHAGVARLLAEHPEMAADRVWARLIIHLHARAGETEFVRALLDAGVDVNIPEDDVLSSRPLFSAVSGGSAEIVRLLLERGSDVNWDWGGGPTYCAPLAIAVREGRIDIVQMLVEAGALLNVIDRAGQTPLSWAIANGRHEIIEYLRSKGAMLPHETPGYVPPPPPDPFEEAVRATVGDIIEEPFAQDGPVTVRLGLGPEEDEYFLFTRGMSSRAMDVPPVGEAYRHAELVLYLNDVHSTVADDWPDSEYWWLADWMLRIARWPFDNDTWLNGKWTIISNEDPPEPLSEYTEMTCWLLLGEKEPLARAELPEGKSVCFYTLMPIHTAERDLALSEGLVALLQRFAEHDVPLQLNPHRESVV